MTEKIIIIVVSAIIALILLLPIISIILFSYVFKFNKNKPVKTKVPDEYKNAVEEGYREYENAKKEEIFIKSKDNLTLRGYLIEGKKRPDVTVICFHGYKSGISDFSGAFKYYLKSGCNLIFVEQRAHGKSEGKYITFGVKESDDAVNWAIYAKNRFDGIIYLAGISMGASTVLFASGKNLPKEVKGIIADCGFTSPYEIMKHVAKTKFRMPAFLSDSVFFFINIYAKIHGFSIYENTEDYVKKCKIPIIITHGKADKFVPYEMSVKNAAACNCVYKLVLIDNARHGFAYIVNPKDCYAAIEDVFQQDSPVFYDEV